MTSNRTSSEPALLRDFVKGSAGLERELEDLATLDECGLPVASIVVVPSAAESEFYRLNNLASLLQDHFRSVKLSDPDDEDIEDLSPGARALVYGHFLLDEFVDRFYGATQGMPEEMRVRRPDHDGLAATGSRAGLLAVKRVWSSDWSFESIWARLSSGGPLLPAPRPSLVHPAPLQPLPAELSRDASALLGRQLELLGEPATGISRIVAAIANGA